MYKVVSLFSGAGGFDWGFHLTSKFTTCLANELKAVPAETFAKNLSMKLVHTPASPHEEDQPLMIQGDVAEVSFACLNGFEPHLLVGGPPCQDFSVVKAGQRKGIQVKRGRLYAQFVRAVTALQPSMFVFENVPGLMSTNKGQAYDTILEDFTNLRIRWREIQEASQVDNGWKRRSKHGYEIIFNGVVDASKLGVPQTRRRLIIIGLRDDLAHELGLFRMVQIREHLKHELTGAGSLMSRYPVTCMEVLEGRTIIELQKKYKEVMDAYDKLWNNPLLPKAADWKRKVWDSLSFDALKDYLLVNHIQPKNTSEIEKAMSEHGEVLKKLGYFGQRVDKLKPKDGTNQVQESDSVMERMRRIPPGQNHEFVRGTPWHVEGRGISLIYRRPYPLKPAPTVVAYGGGGTWGYHYERDRGKLANRERARIQTFTDDFLFAGSPGEIRGQIGEAVPPLLAEKIANALLKVLSVVK